MSYKKMNQSNIHKGRIIKETKYQTNFKMLVQKRRNSILIEVSSPLH